MFLAELARFDNSQNVKMMTSDQIEPILFLAGDGSAEESAKTEKAVVFVQRVRGRGPWEKTCSWIVLTFLAELARFDNSQNVKMRLPALRRHFHVSRIPETSKCQSHPDSFPKPFSFREFPKGRQ